jgi:hypothetical protein
MTPAVKVRCYKELSRLKTFDERFNYLKLGGEVGKETFGFDRYLNQALYHTEVWRRIRRDVIIRDEGCDLGDPDRPIDVSRDWKTIDGKKSKRSSPIIIHHMNPITAEEIEHRDSTIFEPEFLITTVLNTHNGIHYGDESLLPKKPVMRTPNDTCPWR